MYSVCIARALSVLLSGRDTNTTLTHESSSSISSVVMLDNFESPCTFRLACHPHVASVLVDHPQPHKMFNDKEDTLTVTVTGGDMSAVSREIPCHSD